MHRFPGVDSFHGALYFSALSLTDTLARYLCNIPHVVVPEIGPLWRSQLRLFQLLEINMTNFDQALFCSVFFHCTSICITMCNSFPAAAGICFHTGALSKALSFLLNMSEHGAPSALSNTSPISPGSCPCAKSSACPFLSNLRLLTCKLPACILQITMGFAEACLRHPGEDMVRKLGIYYSTI